jgi:DNA-binding transcriptional LysR family regulator
MDRTDRIGRRLRLRDLQLLDVVVRSGSIAKAAGQLNLTQPAASKAITQLELAIGVRLLDRSARGVVPTTYGNALLRRGLTIFDELRQGINDIEFLSDSTAGEVRVGCPEATLAGLLPAILEQLGRQYLRLVCSVTWLPPAIHPQLRELRERRVDLLLMRSFETNAEHDLQAELLFHDAIRVAAGKRSKWQRRRKIELSELVDEPWIVTPPESEPFMLLAQAFEAKGLKVPSPSVVSTSVHIANGLLPAGRHVTILPESILRFGTRRGDIKPLPVSFPARPRPIAIVTLKNRTLSPGANLFIEAARQVTRSLATANKKIVRSR